MASQKQHEWLKTFLKMSGYAPGAASRGATGAAGGSATALSSPASVASASSRSDDGVTKQVAGVNASGVQAAGAPLAVDDQSAKEEFHPESPAQPLDDHKKKAWFEEDDTPPPKDDPKIVSHSDKTFEVSGDTVDTFIERANAHLGGREAGHTEIILDTSPRFKDGKCVRAGVTVTTTITRPVWGGGRPPSDDHKKAIQKAVQLIKDHEGRHRQAAIDVAKQAVTDAVGKTQTTAEAILDQIGTKNNEAQAALDAKEGKITSVNGGKDVKLEPAN